MRGQQSRAPEKTNQTGGGWPALAASNLAMPLEIVPRTPSFFSSLACALASLHKHCRTVARGFIGTAKLSLTTDTHGKHYHMLVPPSNLLACTSQIGGLPPERGCKLCRCSTMALNGAQQLLRALRSARHDGNDHLQDRLMTSGKQFFGHAQISSYVSSISPATQAELQVVWHQRMQDK